jgi:hypothetical protein
MIKTDSDNYNDKILGTVIPLVFTVICIMMYNNMKPYAQWQNDVLQQVCQINIAFTLMVSLVLEGISAQEEIDRLRDSVQTFPAASLVEVVMIFLFSLSVFCGIVLSILETPASRVEEISKNARKFFKLARGLRRGFQRNVVFVDPKFRYFRKFKSSMLLAEEHGGGVSLAAPRWPISACLPT